jgi:enamine deaminase RidA (YjgF/YER057c/UK114 family)
MIERVGAGAIPLALAAMIGTAGTASAQTAPPQRASPPAEVTFYGSPTAQIAAGVVIPANAAFVWTSGTVPAAIAGSKPDDPARFGDTRTQAVSVLKAIEGQLTKQGLTMKDVIYLRAYLVADPAKGAKIDMDGWSAAYKEFFGTAQNPTKPARSTVGVAALVNPLWLIEIEAVAVFPPK